MASASGIGGSQQQVVKKSSDKQSSSAVPFPLFSALTAESVDKQIEVFSRFEKAGHLDASGFNKLIGLRLQKLEELSKLLLDSSGDVSGIKSAILQLKTSQLATLQSLQKIATLSSSQTAMMEQLTKELDSSSVHYSIGSSSAMGFTVLPDDAVVVGDVDGGKPRPLVSSHITMMSSVVDSSSALVSTVSASALLVNVDAHGDDDSPPSFPPPLPPTHSVVDSHNSSSAAAVDGGSKSKLEAHESKAADLSTSQEHASIKNITFMQALAHIGGSSCLIELCDGGSPAVKLKQLAFYDKTTSEYEYMNVFEVVCDKKGTLETYYVWDERSRPDGAKIDYARGQVRDRIPGKLISCNVDGLIIKGAHYKLQGAKYRFLTTP